MRILVLGAGGVGGYFGARLHEAGGDVTFLVRPARAEKLAAGGLQLSSPCGDASIVPKLVTGAAGEDRRFDVVMLSCKAYDLDSALDAVAGLVASEGVVLPLLNGLAHLDTLDARFGRDRVLGGVAHISAALGPAGEIRHLNKIHRVIVGARSAPPPRWLAPFAELLAAASFDSAVSEDIEQSMWDKFVFLCTLAAATCTMRANLGEILRTCAGEGFMIGLLDECERVAVACGHPPSEDQFARYRSQLADRDSTIAASMLRDVERGGPTEADHIIGDMVRRGEEGGVDVPLLKLAYSHLQAYALARQRKQAEGGGK